MSGLDRLTPRVVGVAFFANCVLLTRPGDTEWELPGGRRIRGERNPACIIRWFAEQLGLKVMVGGPMGMAGFASEDGWKSFVAYGCRLSDVDGLRVPEGYQEARLFRSDELDGLHLENAYRDFIAKWTSEVAAGGPPMGPPKQ